MRRLDARKLSTVTAPVLFVPELARGLFGHFLGAIRGGSQYRRASFLLDAAGKQIFPAWMQISERPHLRKALGSAPFDSEGVVDARPRDHRGRRADGLRAEHVFRAQAGAEDDRQRRRRAQPDRRAAASDDFEALLRQMDRGLVVTELMGQGVNGVTGDYSRGAAGFWVENGAIAYPVHEITIAGNLKDMYRDDRRRRQRRRPRGGIRTGSVLLERDDDRRRLKSRASA